MKPFTPEELECANDIVAHTPAPWKLASGGTLVTSADEANSVMMIQALIGCNGGTNKLATARANERLIVAAPELLEAIEKMLMRWSDYLHFSEAAGEAPDGAYLTQARQYGERARAVIAKARGYDLVAFSGQEKFQ